MKIVKNLIPHNLSGKTSSLLIPGFLYPYLVELKKRHGGLKKVFGMLIKKFYQKQNKVTFHQNVSSTIVYQKTGLDLRRENFRPVEKEWIELKILACSYNMSVCKFFVMLLRMEMAGALESEGVPTIITQSSLHQSLTLSTIPQFTRLFRLRI